MPDTFLSTDFATPSDSDAQMHRLLTLINLIRDPTSISGPSESGFPAPGGGMTLAGSNTENGLFAYNSILNEEATAIADARRKADSAHTVSRLSGGIHSSGASPVAPANSVTTAAPMMLARASTLAAAAATNSYSFTITSATQFNADVALIDVGGKDSGGTNNTYNFNITASFTLDRQLDAINLTNGTASGDVLNISGTGASGGVATLDGGGKYNGLFVYDGNVNVTSLTIQNAVAAGGAGGLGGGGGGAGLGGGLFVAGPNPISAFSKTMTTGGNVSLQAVIFAGDQAVGGASGSASTVSLARAGGGGGLGGAGGAGGSDYGGGGGVGLGASGGTGKNNGGAGILLGANPGGSAVKGGAAGGANGGGGGSGGRYSSGGGGGVGGAAQYIRGGFYYGSVPGGFGGGGSSETPSARGGLGGGGAGGFGGGGGGEGASGLNYGAKGGFGGGGGGGYNVVSGGSGGFGAGKGGNSKTHGDGGAGGGGLGAGADVFVQQGGHLTIEGGTSLGLGTVTGGGGNMSYSGAAFGSGMFIQGSQTVTFGGVGGPVTVAGVIADESGSVVPSGDGTGTGAGALAVGDVLLTLSGANTYSGGTTITGGSLDLDQADIVANGKVVSGAAGTGAIIFAGSAAAPSYLTFEDVAQPANGGTFATTLTNFGANDALFLKSVTYTSTSTAIYNATTHLLTVSSDGKTESFTLNAPTGTSFYTHAPEFGSGMRVDTVQCYCRGTRIETPVGDVEIEALAVGDLVVTASGAVRPIIWIGTRRFDPRFVGRNPKLLPIRICRDALADGIPRRDLLVSPEHAMLIDGVLIAAKYLINGVSIRQEEPGSIIEYFHLELASHDAVRAEGAASETYIEDGDRGMFHNAPAFRPPNLAPPHYCAERIEAGARLEAIRAALDARAGLFAIATAAPGLHLLADGQVVAPREQPDGVFVFTLPEAPAELVLASLIAEPVGADRRGLGVAVRSITIDGSAIDLQTLPDAGWHDLEREGDRHWRWTNGAATLPAVSQACRIEVTAHAAPRYRIHRVSHDSAMPGARGLAA